MSEDELQVPDDPGRAGVAGPTEYVGNTNDLIALTAAVSGLSLCAYLTGNGLFCCLPVLLGAAGLALAKDARDPVRARNLSIIGILSVGLLLALLVACVVAYLGFILALGLGSGSGVLDLPRVPVF